MKSKEKILVVGSSNTDIVINTDHFPQKGETVIGYGFMTNRGGKGANQAVAASRLGGNVIFVGKLGKDSLGKEAIAALQKEKIDLSYLKITDKVSSGVALITTFPDGDNTIIVNPGANSLLSPNDIRDAETAFTTSKILLMQLEIPVKTLTEAARIAKKYGSYVVLNPAPAPKQPLPKELLKNVDILIPNETEAEQIFGVTFKDKDSVKQAMVSMESLGVKDVIITMGSKGVLARINGTILGIPACKVEAVDTTGAGDTFCGALCVSLSQGNSMEESIRFANTASSISVTRRGAQMAMPYLNEVKEAVSI
jgi:ribokinase